MEEESRYRGIPSGQAGGAIAGAANIGAQQRAAPRFEKSLVITTPSLVVDLDGYSWWVDPAIKQLIRA